MSEREQVEEAKIVHCAVCGEIQFWCRSGWTCSNGHGGAPIKEELTPNEQWAYDLCLPTVATTKVINYTRPRLPAPVSQPVEQEKNEDNHDVRVVRHVDRSVLGPEETRLIPLPITDDRNQNPGYSAWEDLADSTPSWAATKFLRAKSALESLVSQPVAAPAEAIHPDLCGDPSPQSGTLCIYAAGHEGVHHGVDKIGAVEWANPKKPESPQATSQYINPNHKQDCQLRYVTAEEAKAGDWGCTCKTETPQAEGGKSHEHKFFCPNDQQQCDTECRLIHSCSICSKTRADLESQPSSPAGSDILDLAWHKHCMREFGVSGKLVLTGRSSFDAGWNAARQQSQPSGKVFDDWRSRKEAKHEELVQKIIQYESKQSQPRIDGMFCFEHGCTNVPNCGEHYCDKHRQSQPAIEPLVSEQLLDELIAPLAFDKQSAGYLAIQELRQYRQREQQERRRG